ncbi:MAG: hypothetical protein AAES65_07805 [Candidatus Thiodiazotropha sp. (ex. Lucinoma kazani)]
MPEQINLLVVEDNQDMFDTYQDTAEELSSDEIHLSLISKKSAGEAKSALLSGNFDGAIVDLNLDPSTPTKPLVMSSFVKSWINIVFQC